jgi:hypothetical protein
MTSIDFPNSPSVNDTYTVRSRTWQRSYAFNVIEAAFTFVQPGFNNQVDTVAVQSDGKVLVGGSFIQLMRPLPSKTLCGFYQSNTGLAKALISPAMV